MVTNGQLNYADIFSGKFAVSGPWVTVFWAGEQQRDQYFAYIHRNHTHQNNE